MRYTLTIRASDTHGDTVCESVFPDVTHDEASACYEEFIDRLDRRGIP